ncbi:MAG: holo-ACP synthase [Solirubrobacterales bacterium]
MSQHANSGPDEHASHPAATDRNPSSGTPQATGVGIDLVDVSRIERALERRPRLASRLFTERELEYAGTHRRPARHLAARFAAKEAVVKALGLGPGTCLREIEVIPGHPPQVKLHAEVGRFAVDRNLAVKISLTHERDMAGAVAVAGEA